MSKRFHFDRAAASRDIMNDLKIMFWEMDTNVDGVISFDEFVAYN